MHSLTIIIPEHKEPKENIMLMLRQIEQLNMPVEVIIVSSAPQLSIDRSYPFPARVITNVMGSGSARNKGVEATRSDILLFTDSHCCLNYGNIKALMQTLMQYPDAVIAPGIQPTEFPQCGGEGGIGYGVYFTSNFDWKWLGKVSDTPFPAPFASACFLMMKRKTFHDSIIGYIPIDGVGFDEEICLRLAHMGHKTIINPEVTVLHLFKKTYPAESTVGYVPSRAIATVLSVFDKSLFDEIDHANREHWGESWKNSIEKAWSEYGNLRDALYRRRRERVNERWYFRPKE